MFAECLQEVIYIVSMSYNQCQLEINQRRKKTSLAFLSHQLIYTARMVGSVRTEVSGFNGVHSITYVES